MPSLDGAQDAPHTTLRTSLRTWLGNGLIYLSSLAVAALSIEPLLPEPGIPGASDKLRHLDLHGNDYDTIFVGSSRVNFQVLPSVYDRVNAESGRPTKSFNDGLLGMRPPEQGYFLDRTLSHPHRRLRWVFVELTSIEARTPKTRRGSARYLAWHDGPRMRLLGTWLRAEWKTIREGDSAAPPAAVPAWIDMWEPLSVWLMHFGYFCQRSCNLGRGEFVGDTWIMGPAERVKQRKKFRFLGEDRDGWLPYDGAREIMDDRERASYLESFTARLATPAVHFHDPASDAATEAMRRAVIQAGAIPIFFVPPMTTGRHYYPPPEMAKKMIIWNFSDLKRYPRLFLPEHRLDQIHMNTAGGKEFTRALAERFGELTQ
jgi:hypothetical protein